MLERDLKKLKVGDVVYRTDLEEQPYIIVRAGDINDITAVRYTYNAFNNKYFRYYAFLNPLSCWAFEKGGIIER